jgi:hypothetical protein
MSLEGVRVSGEWLALREPADAAARSRDLAARLASTPPAGGRWTIHDLGGGTGSMGRWLAPLLPGPQLWVVHDRDADLLGPAAAASPGPAADGAPVSIEARRSDITALPVGEMAGASAITASALLDMLTAEELDSLVSACAVAGCPALLTLSVVGRVELTPPEPLDERIAAAFNDHQRRVTDRGALLGPDAFAYAVRRFDALGADVLVRPTPWRLGAEHAGLIGEWFSGWVDAACEQEPGLAAEAAAYRRRRRDQAAAGELAVLVGHADLLAIPAGHSDQRAVRAQSV